jgi:hypothetical protein
MSESSTSKLENIKRKDPEMARRIKQNKTNINENECINNPIIASTRPVESQHPPLNSPPWVNASDYPAQAHCPESQGPSASYSRENGTD